MRITGGLYRGRVVTCPPGEIRPAMDKMRESLFSILGNISDTSFLDLFSGSGLVGIEAASRGAEPVHLVEMDGGKKPTIQKNIGFVESDIKLFVANVLRFLPQAKQQYHIVYADPPFPMKNKTALATLVDKHHVLEPGGLFIIHYPAEEQKLWPQQIGSLTWIDERKYGRSLLRFYKETRTDHADIERHL
ncbi:MAG TPA: 16S rRNA (guanine(966)-N(2))-methyltransferase RsmD [Sphaerochaeta sp.]|nr:MAG: 16S rRNA (guanine(966)-N(2))-methyltransferase RsmD [Spirochaetes bacterium GWC2_52_13]OHD65196.1 MAG: 16S rRNA (guanine(966)-N(2))-methyltransferase RsmD [Spirochaetes bacterium GWF2_52_7]PKL10715.1 MAG: 16S rRNA (guanine(966)-N(2))-methyltransferase RsmD [Spirochaetae bacterium HGW-Spirochaetae-8]PKL22112.1 MAG: 16S rRNA (guanine(966)-N(2))-methyltransferase RsmD [Spirochaetae bacterium HGW-Spirochaetae-4]HCG64304.1 16S rRNA (guanine(966)-N(2))-methyltransferase RsmD [Sphaerochaeta sp